MRERTFSWLRQILLSQRTLVVIASVYEFLQTKCIVLTKFPTGATYHIAHFGGILRPQGLKGRSPKCSQLQLRSQDCWLSTSEVLHDLDCCEKPGQCHIKLGKQK